MVVWELKSQLWAAEFLQLAEIGQGGEDYDLAVGGWSASLRRSVRIRENLSG